MGPPERTLKRQLKNRHIAMIRYVALASAAVESGLTSSLSTVSAVSSVRDVSKLQSSYHFSYLTQPQCSWGRQSHWHTVVQLVSYLGMCMRYKLTLSHDTNRSPQLRRHRYNLLFRHGRQSLRCLIGQLSNYFRTDLARRNGRLPSHSGWSHQTRRTFRRPGFLFHDGMELLVQLGDHSPRRAVCCRRAHQLLGLKYELELCLDHHLSGCRRLHQFPRCGRIRRGRIHFRVDQSHHHRW